MKVDCRYVMLCYGAHSIAVLFCLCRENHQEFEQQLQKELETRESDYAFLNNVRFVRPSCIIYITTSTQVGLA